MSKTRKPLTGRIGRRSFLRKTRDAAMGLVALQAASPASAAKTQRPEIRRYRTLGRTGLKVSDIGFGSSGCRSADTIRYCYDAGVNYFDTAERYRTEGWGRGGYVEDLMGEALSSVRDMVVITTKTVAGAKQGRHDIMKELEESLRRLRTDYVDIFLNHAVNDPERMANPEWHEFVQLAKKQGKIRFSGMSGHGGRLQECLDYVLDNDMVDVVLCSHNFGVDPRFYERFTKHFDFAANQQGIPRLFAKAKEKNVGVIAMKTMSGAKANDLSAYRHGGASYERAAMRWVFSDPHIDSAIISMPDKAVADAFIACSGDAQFAENDFEVLDRFLAAAGDEYCRPGCDACEQSCPQGVPIADVLRQRMYEVRYGAPRKARAGYARLGTGASACGTCSDQRCLGSCPWDLDIPKLTRDAAQRLA